MPDREKACNGISTSSLARPATDRTNTKPAHVSPETSKGEPQHDTVLINRNGPRDTQAEDKETPSHAGLCKTMGGPELVASTAGSNNPAHPKL